MFQYFKCTLQLYLWERKKTTFGSEKLKNVYVLSSFLALSVTLNLWWSFPYIHSTKHSNCLTPVSFFFLQSKVALLPSESYTVGDLKGEILSLKGLLLNRWAEHKQVTGSVIMKYWIFYLWICYPFNSLHPDISVHFLQTLLYTFPLTPTRIICITIKVS